MAKSRTRSGTITGVIVSLGCVLAGCSSANAPTSPTSAASPTPTPSPLDLHSVDWNSVSVPGSACNSQADIKLTGGIALIPDSAHGNPGSGGAAQKVDRLSVGHVTYGQLETGNQDDAALELSCSIYSGTASGALLYTVAVFS